MMDNTSFISNTLKDHLKVAQKRNKNISVRWLAQRLSISPSMTSMIFNGKRVPSLTILKEACRLLDIDNEVEDRLRVHLLKNKFLGPEDINFANRPQDTSVKYPDEDWQLAHNNQFVALEEWYYFAIMQTMLLKDYDGTSSFISEFLALDFATVEDAIGDLVKVGLVETDPSGKTFHKTNTKVKFNSRNRQKLTNHHIKNMEKVVEALEGARSEYNRKNRLVTSSCFSCRSQDLPIIKQKIAEIVEEIAGTEESEGHDEVCFFLAQLLPLSNR